MRILCVEDNELVARYLEILAESVGWELEICERAEPATEMIESARCYDAIIIDAELFGWRAVRDNTSPYSQPSPNIGSFTHRGLELVRLARSMAHRRDTPIIVFSAAECEEEAYLAGCDLFLRKPKDTGLLVEHVSRLTTDASQKAV